MTFPTDARQRLIDYLDTHHVNAGLGTREEACSLAAINLALTGKLTDKIPDCMSLILGTWITHIQDYMPDELRNSKKWKALLPEAAGTGRDREDERLHIIIDWMWEIVLPQVLPFAHEHGFGDEWQHMLDARTPEAAEEVRNAAYANFVTNTPCESLIYDNREVMSAATVAFDVKNVAEDTAHVVDIDDYVCITSFATNAATNTANLDTPAFWTQVNPCSLLQRLINV
jgi:hypothetical protein